MTQRPFDYTGRDYSTLRDQLKNYFQGRVPEWSSDPSDPVQVLIEAMAYMGDMLSYYVDIAAQESTILSSNSPANVFAHALLYGYQPSLALSSETELEVSYQRTSSDLPEKVELDKGREVFDSRTGLVFEVQEPITLFDGQVLVVQAWEGTTRKERIGTSSGAAGQRMPVPLGPGTFVDGREGTTTLYVATPYDVTTWVPTYNLLDHGPNDHRFALMTDASGNTSVVFGDGVSGAIPAAGAEIILEYRQCSGSVGNNVAAGALRQWYMSYDNPQLTAGNALSVTNRNAPRGGVDVETLDSVREQTVKFSRAQRRAVTSDDYARVARSSGEVLTAFSEAEVWSQPRVWILPRDEAVLTEAAPKAGESRRSRILGTVDRAITALSMVGTSPVVAYGDVAPVSVTVEAHVWAPVDVRYAASRIREAIIEEFSYAKCDFEREISEDYVLRVIRDKVDNDLVRFAQVSSMTANASVTSPLSLFPGMNQVDADYTPIKGFAPRSGYALVVRDEGLRIVVIGQGKRYVDEKGPTP